MKKSLSLMIIVLLILTGIVTTANNNIKNNTNIIKNISERSTHTVLGEYGTATWCGYCKYAHGALKQLFEEGSLDFYYVSLVTDKNSKANTRCSNDYNVYGYPTVWWDGGYIVNVGASSVEQAKSAYTASINTCSNRAVENVGTILEVNWLGGTEMQINISITNYETSTYGGTIRVYITEKVSSMGWYDTSGQLYTHAFLDWAFNQGISIPTGNTWTNSMTWDGSDYGYTTITANNILIIAAVFNDQWYQGYSYPPNGNPFNAYYVDEVVAISPTVNNDPPNTPSNPNPSDGTINVDVNADLSWTCNDPNGDTLTYDVYFGTTNPPPILISNQTGTTYNPGTMNTQTTYYWKIIAWDPYDEYSSSSIWDFTTASNSPPNTPSNPSPTDGATNVNINSILSWTCTDPNEDSLTYDVYFGTSSNPPLVSQDQSDDYYDPPGNMNQNTKYYWKIVAEDEYGASTTSPIWSFTTGTESQPNDPPYIPSNPNPENKSINIELDIILSWIGGDPDLDDTVVYDVYLEANNPNPNVKISDDQNKTYFDPESLKDGTIYYWRVNAKDNHNYITKGPIWHFTTITGNPPNNPTITGPTKIKTNTFTNYTFTSTDPNDDDIYYYIEWGDGTNSGWQGPYISGESYLISHSWNNQNTFTIKCKTKDSNNLESNWGNLDITVPKNKTIINLIIERFSQNHPLLQKLLNIIGQ